MVVGFTAPVFPVEEGSGTAIVCFATDTALMEEVTVEVTAFEIATGNFHASGVCVCVCVYVCVPVVSCPERRRKGW